MQIQMKWLHFYTQVFVICSRFQRLTFHCTVQQKDYPFVENI